MNSIVNNEFAPVITSSPAKKLPLLHYGENNLELTISNAVLQPTPAQNNKTRSSLSSLANQKWKNVEKCRGVNSRFNLPRAHSVDQSNFVRIVEVSTSSLYNQENFFNNCEEITESASLSQHFSFAKNVQRIQFEAGLRNRLMNQYNKPKSKPIESAANSFISSIVTSINSSVKRNFYSSKTETFLSGSFSENCSCCRNKSQESESFEQSAQIANYLTFDVKMASTPIINKRKSFNMDKLTNKKRSKHQVKHLNLDDCNCYLKRPQIREHCLYKSSEKPIRMKSSSRKPEARLYKNDLGVIPSNVTSSEIINCNGYLKNFLKKSTVKTKKLSDIQKLQLKKRMQKLNNISTSTKKENAIINTEKKAYKKQRDSRDNLKKIEDFKRKVKTEFSKRVKLESAAIATAVTHLPIQNSENIINFNNYFPSSCLNKFNQLGQLQVWFV